MQFLAYGVGAEQNEVNLHVRRCQRGIGLEEPTGVAGSNGQRSFPVEYVVKHRSDLFRKARHHVVDGDRFVTTVVVADLEMILDYFNSLNLTAPQQ